MNESARNAIRTLLLLSASLTPLIQAEAETVWPFCSGYHSESGSWGYLSVSKTRPLSVCAPGEALLSHVVTSPVHDAAEVAVTGACCPLPAESLAEVHHWAVQRCPSGSVITGARLTSADVADVETSPQTFEIRCTLINSGRFELAPARRGVRIEPFIEFGEVLKRLFDHDPIEIRHWKDLPANIRYGVSRDTRTLFRMSSHVGFPWNSVLVGIGDPGSDFLFSELRERGSTVHIPPQCDALADIFSPSPRCVAGNSQNLR